MIFNIWFFHEIKGLSKQDTKEAIKEKTVNFNYTKVKMYSRT